MESTTRLKPSSEVANMPVLILDSLDRLESIALPDRYEYLNSVDRRIPSTIVRPNTLRSLSVTSQAHASAVVVNFISPIRTTCPGRAYNL